MNDPTSPYRPHLKAAHRADSNVGVAHGSHGVFTQRWRSLPHWHPVEALHFPFRSSAQWERKGVRRRAGTSRSATRSRAARERDRPGGERLRRALVDDAEPRAGWPPARSSKTRGSATRFGRCATATSRPGRPARGRRQLRTSARWSPRAPGSETPTSCGSCATSTGFAPASRARGGRAGSVATRLAGVKLVSVVVPRDDADVLDAHLRFHLNAGVDHVLVGGDAGGDEIASILAPYVQGGQVERVTGTWRISPRGDRARRGLGPPADADEFWWPRGESLKDVLAAIPPRYEIVQGLVRDFCRRQATGTPSSRA